MSTGKPHCTKSSSPNKRKSNTMGSFKYGTYIPRIVDEAIACDKKNGNTLWRVKVLMDMGTLKILGRGQANDL